MNYKNLIMKSVLLLIFNMPDTCSEYLNIALQYLLWLLWHQIYLNNTQVARIFSHLAS